MAIAIVHYHLRRGGVTRVIEAQSRVLREAGTDHVILSGTACDGSPDLPVTIVPGLDYSTGRDAHPGLTDELHAAAREALGAEPAIWHIHNPTLGKNVDLPPTVQQLAESHAPLILQFHDFAEDGRPENYELLGDHTHLYPVAPQIQYAFINSRDRDLLIAAGVPEANTSLLPNAVIPPAVPDDPARDHPLVLYPVRGIRRKNLGEFCLLAGLSPADARFAMTLAPENPHWRPVYDRWVRFAGDHDLPCQFGVVDTLEPSPGVAPTFENWLAHSSHLLTTSIAEGFGLAFLEPVALRKPLLGRDLPDITRDFKRDGCPLGTLYEQLLIPSRWIDRTALLAELEDNLRSTYRRYGTSLAPKDLDRALAGYLATEHLDFGNLPESAQREAAARALQDPEEVQIETSGALQPAPEWINRALRTNSAADPSLLDPFTPERYARRLRDLHAGVAGAVPAPPGWLPRQAVLAQFLNPASFHFLPHLNPCPIPSFLPPT